MVQCDQCKEWFHGRCVHITQEQVDKLSRYYCATCKRRRNERGIQEKNTQQTTTSTINTTNTTNNTNTNVNNTTTSTATSNNTNIVPVNTTYPPQPLPLPQSAGPPFSSSSSDAEPITKRLRAEGDGFSSLPSSPTHPLSPSHHSLPSSPSRVPLSPREPWASSEGGNDREKFWEIIRRSRGQA
eukprot:Phypoly_transcript_17456.p1 GENE.Phypoly_transcript_17456~~Phypoly_transcript_17456.p1  ORF type:complete len:184 (+),score=49.05 Phypoly_transcript_17456:203-754(+)